MDLRPIDSFMAWFGPTALITVFCWFLFGQTPVRDLACTGVSNCLHAWIDALGGWAAAVAAFATIWFISKQISDSNRQHAELVRLQLQPTIALTERIEETAMRFRPIARNVRAFLVTEPRSDQDRENAYNGGMRELCKAIDLLSSTDFDTFESQVGSGQPHTLTDVRHDLKKLVDFGPGPHRFDQLHRTFEGRRDRIIHAINDADAYCTNCVGASRKYLELWSRLVR